MARRNDHSKEELENLILKTAINIVESEGFQALTARRLAKDVGYTPGTIYHVYGSMEGVYFMINAKTLENLYEAINIPPQNTPAEDIKHMARAYMDFAHENKALWLMIFNQPLSHDEKAPDWYKELVEHQFAPLEKLLDPLYSTQNAKDKKKAARAIWSTVHGVCLMKETEKMTLISHEDAFDIVEYFIDNFIEGVKR